MPIHEIAWRHYEGRRRGRFARMWAIAECGVTVALKRKALIALVLLCIIPAIILGVFLYQAQNVQEYPRFANMILRGMNLGEAAGPGDLTPEIIWRIIFSRFFIWQFLCVAVVVTLVGPSLISQDLRDRALQIYYSRPITAVDYILGKLLVIAAFIAMITLVPALLLYIVGVVLSKDIHVVVETWRTLVGIFASYALLTAVAGTVMLACSSLSRRMTYVAMVWLAVLLLGDGAYGLLSSNMGAKWSHLFSLRADAAQVVTAVFGVKPDFNYDWPWSLAVLGAAVVVSLVVLFARVGAMEGEH